MRLKHKINGTLMPLIGNDWELIPDEPVEQWVDVTAECDVTPETWPSRTHSASNGIMSHNGLMLWVCREDHAKGYRLRKVKVFDEHGQNLLNRWAFLVERREQS